ncbi:MAG: DegT/DnrJ/EryC1/StrS family aminotransferase [Xanthomonadales bacterium]|jgi:dTDP-4-amino-4,6-dideoxygalactose transaminase|nr:DegT/DnrJ/EryC1/StrS family aminotransferase [Xanthomonadales bacterium]
MIPVTRATLPPLKDYVQYLKGIWSRGHLTNNGPLVVELERRLREYLQVPHVFLVANGMLGLHIAIRALGMHGRVVTTPFSYVATTAAPVWEGLTPVFADIDDSCCLDPAAVARVCADAVGGIIATHVYGNACDVEGLAQLARERGVPILYDAAHGFGARLSGRSLCAYGDISMVSLHATKLFHTVEGGLLITANDEYAARIARLRNFGHDGPDRFDGVGTNAKMSELHAAMGLCNLDRFPQLLLRRRELSALYEELLHGLPLQYPRWRPGLERNGAYFPVIFQSEAAMRVALQHLNAEQIFPRRYFHPSLSQLNYVDRGEVPIAESVASRVVCLPLWAELEALQVRRISSILARVLDR